MLKLYAAFHLNLMFSSIEVEQHREVIKRCYWPILDLASKGFPLAVEAPVLTLELIQRVDPLWVERLAELIMAGRIEFIGSGYSQMIGPLAPATANRWNLGLGQFHYKNLLGRQPDIALINEMAYSSGLLEIYRDVGYKAFLMEWNNPLKANPNWDHEWKFHPQIARGPGSVTLPVIWVDSIAFQKFQRYAHDEMDLADYLDFIGKHEKNGRHFPLYANDVEIFDYRPGRFEAEATMGEESEWHRIESLLATLHRDDSFELIFPSQVLDDHDASNAWNQVDLSSAEQPIPVKKQEKYNLHRWALSGRADQEINTRCNRIMKAMQDEQDDVPADFQAELCRLWSSDFRTHITKKRWTAYLGELETASQRWGGVATPDNRPGESLDYSKHIRSEGEYVVTPERKALKIAGNGVKAVFNPQKGNTLLSATFGKVSGNPLIGTLSHGYYDDIALGADFYTGHAVVIPPVKHKIVDLATVHGEQAMGQSGLFIRSACSVGGIGFETIYGFGPDKLIISKCLTLPERRTDVIHPVHLTFLPDAWDRNSLYFATHNGGEQLETFLLGDRVIRHKELLSALISAVHGLGATAGVLYIGDKDKCLQLTHDPAVSFLIPGITYLPLANGQFFLRVTYSAQEMDETFQTANVPQTILAEVEISPVEHVI